MTIYSFAAATAKVLQSCPILCDPIDGSSPGSPVPGILQARTLEWFAISFSNAWKWKVKVKSLGHVQLLDTPWTAGQPGSSIHGIFQARVLEWVAIAVSNTALMYFFSYLEPLCWSMSSSNCCFLICIQVSQEVGQVVWYSHLFQNFPVYCDPHSQRLWHSQ